MAKELENKELNEEKHPEWKTSALREETESRQQAL
jgi:hypothetical protein